MSPAKKTKVMESFKVKKVGGETYIEGYANKAVVDRGMDIINRDAWQLDNFKKVPILLYNHDKNKPIGKAVDVQATDGGLWVKAKISNSKDAEISMVRDLIEEGILNAFSVGFDSKDEEKDAEGINNIKMAELYEISVVTMPMNQDSTFGISSKDLSQLTKRQAVDKVLRAKGSWVAAAVHDKIYQMQEQGGDRNELLRGIGESSGLGSEDIASILAGNITPVPDAALRAFVQVLGLEEEKLKELNDADVAVEKPKADQKQTTDKPETNQEEVAMKADAPGQIELVALKVPKDQAASADDAAKLAMEAGYSAASVEETDEAFVVLQSEGAKVDEDCREFEIGDGVFAVVRMKAPEAVAPEAPVPAPESDTEEAKMLKMTGRRPATKQNGSPTTPIAGSGSATIPVDDNPYLAEARNTNVLLGVLIQEIRGMSEKLDGAMPPVGQTSEEIQPAVEGEDEELQKAVQQNVLEYCVALEARLKKLGA